MFIEFHCPACNQRLRVPESAAGKQAKCPGCDQINNIPMASTVASEPAAPLPPPGPGQNPFGGSPDAGFAPDPANPFQSPGEVKEHRPAHQGPRVGPPWEQLGKSFNSFIETVKGVLLSPTETFSNMRRKGGFGDPIFFMLTGGLIGGLIGGLFNGLLQGAMFAGLAGMNQGPAPEAGGVMVVQILAGIFGGVVGGTIGNLIGSFISAGIYHGVLMMFKGANQDFEATYRVVAYTTGATSMLNVIPFVGAYAVMIWSIVANIIGLAKAHDTTTGKAAAAVLIPLVICCVLVVGVFALFFGAIAANGMQ